MLCYVGEYDRMIALLKQGVDPNSQVYQSGIIYMYSIVLLYYTILYYTHLIYMYVYTTGVDGLTPLMSASCVADPTTTYGIQILQYLLQIPDIAAQVTHSLTHSLTHNLYVTDSHV